MRCLQFGDMYPTLLQWPFTINKNWSTLPLVYDLSSLGCTVAPSVVAIFVLRTCTTLAMLHPSVNEWRHGAKFFYS